jgi:hypothetical protein
MCSAAAIPTYTINPDKAIQPDDHFTIEDMHLLAGIAKTAQTALGLRHVSTRERAVEESTRGVPGGCSLNLSLANFEGAKLAKLYLQRQENGLVEAYEKAVDGFIKTSINMDQSTYGLLINPGVTKVRDFLGLAYKTSFMILKYHSEKKPSDYGHNVYGGLGRFPITYVPPERVVDVPFIDAPIKADKVIETDAEIDSTVNLLISSYRKAILKSLRDIPTNSNNAVG